MKIMVFNFEHEEETSVRQEWLGMLQTYTNLPSEVRELCRDIVGDATEDSFEYWPDLERQVTETIGWMWMPDCDFCTGVRRQELTDAVTVVMRNIFDEMQSGW